MKCSECFGAHGVYQEVEDFNPGAEPEWSYYTVWHCDACSNCMYQWEDGFEYD